MSVRCTGGVGRRPLEFGEHETRARLAPVLCILLAGAVAVNAARAQSTPDAEPTAQPTAAILATSGTSRTGGDAGLDSVVQAALEKLGVVKLVARPGMDLEAIQLAIDCVGQTPSCLRAAAAQAGVEILVAPGLEHSGKELVVTLLYFDARGDGELRHVVRRQGGSTVDQATLDAVPDMLRELFQIAKPGEAPAPAPAPAEEGREAPPQGRGVPIPPLIVVGAGVAIVGVGIAFGVMMQSTQDAYSTRRVVNTKPSLDAANGDISTGKSQATVANVLYGVGGVAIAAGAVWLALELTQHKEEPGAPQTAMLPWVGPSQLGVALVHRGGTL